MIVVGICASGVFLISLLWLITKKYKLRYRKKLKKIATKEEHPLFAIYGLTFFLYDKLFYKLMNRTKENRDSRLKKIYVKEEVKDYRYLFAGKKIADCIAILYVILIVGCALGISENQEQQKEITQVTRNSPGDGEKKYELVAADEKGEQEKLQLNVEEKRMTTEECQEKIEQEKPHILRKLLGKNKDEKHITKPLVFFSNYGDCNVEIQWEISKEDLIDVEGNIIRAAQGDGEEIVITAHLTLDQVRQDYEILLYVTAKKDTLSTERHLQKIIEEECYRQKINLPGEVDGKRLTYYVSNDSTVVQLMMIGLVVVIAVFFLEDQKLEKRMKERRVQMIQDYPEIVSKLLLYSGAGMSIRNSLERIVMEYRKKRQKNMQYAYEELELVLNKMNSGVHEQQAIGEFGKRSGVHCYIKLANILQQNMKRGTHEMVKALQEEIDHAFTERKNNALKIGEEAGTKLLGPMILMLIIAMIIVIAPALMSMKIM